MSRKKRKPEIAASVKKHVTFRAERAAVEKSVVIPRDRVIFEAWCGGATIRDLAKQHNLKRSPVRRILTKLAGGREKFRELRAGGAGGRVEPFGGKRAGPRAAGAPAVDDRKVPTIGGARFAAPELCEACGVPLPFFERPKACAHCGEPAPRARALGKLWTRRSIWNGNWQQPVFRAPDGREYVEARAQEKADLIYVMTKYPSLPNMRLRLFEESATRKRLGKQEKELERGEAALARKRSRKRAAKLARRSKSTLAKGGSR